MSRYCSDCNNLDASKSKGDGIYNCRAAKKFVNAYNPACEKFQTCYGRNSAEKQKLYELGRDASKKSDDMPIGIYIFWLIILFIAFILGKIMGV